MSVESLKTGVFVEDPLRRILLCWVDGGVLGRNPSPRGVYWSLVVEGGPTIRRKDATYHTNNDAEWLAVREALRWAAESSLALPLVIYSDSCHIVDCYNGKKQIRVQRHAQLYTECRRLAAGLVWVAVQVPKRPDRKPLDWPSTRKWPNDWRPRDVIVAKVGH